MAKGLKNWFEIFKAGTHYSANGVARTWTNADLDKIVKATNFSVPLVVGHVAVNHPVYGKADELKRVNSKLYAKCTEVKNEFEKFVKTSSKGLSVSINPDYTLNHIAFLAVEEPALSDLAPIEFSASSPVLNDAVSYDYNEAKFSTIADVFSSLRDFLIEKFGADTADKIVRKWQLSDLERITDNSQGEIASFCKEQEDLTLSIDFSKKIEEQDAKIKQLQAELTGKKQEDEKSEYSKQLSEKDARIKELEAERAQQTLSKQKAEFSVFCDELTSSCKLTPAQKTLALEVFDKSTSASSYDFSAGTNEVMESVKKLLKELPEQFKKGAYDFSKADNSSMDADAVLGESIANSLK